jgi:hypothetical protein
MIETADAPLRLPHAVVPAGQLRQDEGHSIVEPGQGDDSDLAPPDLSRLEKMFDESRDLTQSARKDQQLDQDYYDGPEQLNSEVRTILKARGQPPIFDNRIAPAIDGILGIVETAKVDPRAFPRNPEDQGSADICTKTLRYIADRSRWQQTKLDCAEDYLKQGLTAAIVEFDGKEIRAEQIRWETFFYDPKSRKNDFSDAKYKGIAKWMYADEITANKDYAERARKLGDLTTVRDNALEETWNDRPGDQMRWVDKRRNRVLVVEIYYQHGGEWLWCVFCAAGWLAYSRSPYVNVLTGETRCPIEAQSFKVDRKNNRYGPIRNMRPMQDEVNARRSRGLHLLNGRQVQNTDPSAPPVDPDTVRDEMARADGIVPTGWQAVPTSDMAAGNLSMLAEAKDSLSRMVPVALAQDLREGNAASGRARQVAQQAGLTQFGRGFGRLEDFEERIYRQFWMAAQQFWTAPMYIRITDNPRAPDFLQINIPQMATGIVQNPDGSTGIGQVQVGVDKQIAAMDMDIIIGTTPDTVALEQEVFEALMELVRSGADPFSPQFELLIEMSPLPDKVRVLERLKAFRDEVQQAQAQQAQQQAQQAEEARQMALAKARSDINKSDADAEYTAARTQGENVKTEIAALHALIPPEFRPQQTASLSG